MSQIPAGIDAALLTPPERLTRAQERAIEKARVDRAPSVFQGASDAARTQWAGSWALHYMDTGFVTPDEQWQPTKDDWTRLTDGIPLHQLDEFDGAAGLAHAEAIRAKLLNINERRGRLADMGFTGQALTVLAGILDPVNVGSAFLTGGLTYASVGSRAMRIAAFAGENAAISAGFAGLQLAQDPDMQLNDFVFAVGGGAALGGPLGELGHAWRNWGKSAMKEADVAAMRRVRPQSAMGAAAGNELRPDTIADALRTVRSGDPGAIVDAAGTTVPRPLADSLSPKARAFYRDQIAKSPLEQRRAFVDDFVNEAGLHPDVDSSEINALREMMADPDVEVKISDDIPDFDFPAAHDEDFTGVFGFDAKGPAKPPRVPGEPDVDAPKPIPPKIAGDLWLRPVAAENWAAGLRWGMSSSLSKVDSDIVKAYGSVTFADTIYKKGGQASPYSWHEWKDARVRAFKTEYSNARTKHLAEWKQLTGKTDGREFNRAIGDGFHNLGFDPKKPVDSPEWRMAADQARLTNDLLNLARRHGVKWAIETPDDASYIHRIPLASKVIATESLLAKGTGERQLADLWAGGIAKASNMDPDKAKKLGLIVVRAIKNIERYTGVDVARMFSAEGGEDALRDAIRTHGGGVVSPEDVDAIIYAVRPRQGKGGGPAAMKRRVDMDLSYGMDMTMKDGATRHVRLSEFYQNDAEALFHKYADEMIGASGEAELLRAMGKHVDPAGGVKFESFDQLEAEMIRDMNARGIAKVKIDRAVKWIQAGRKIGRGIPLEDRGGWFKEFLYRSRLFNVITKSGTFALATAAEAGKILGTFTPEIMSGRMPALRLWFQKAADGKHSNAVLREGVAMFAPGADRVTHAGLARLNEDATIEALSHSKTTRRLQQAANFANEVSGNTQLSVVTQQLAWLGSHENVVSALMNTGRKPNLRRLRALGLEDADWEPLAAAVRKVAYREDGKGPWVVPFSKMTGDDAQYATMLGGAIDRYSRGVALQRDPGADALWMTKEGGKVLTQFRAFSMQTWEKGILHGMAVRDITAATAFIGSVMSAALFYTAQTYLDSLGQADPDKYRRERLTMKKIGANAWARSGFSSMVPTAYDTIAQGLFGAREDMFVRYSGLDSQLGLGSFPTGKMLMGGMAAAKAGVQVARRPFGYRDRMTASDRRNLVSFVPYGRHYPIKTVLDLWTSYGAKSEPRSQQ